MAVRASMAELISRLRTLVGDPAGADQVFSDQALQDCLDHRQMVARYARLRPEPSFLQGGEIEYHDYYADEGYWEGDETLYDGEYHLLTPTSADRLTGHWAFSASQIPPVLIVGKYYDVYGAAADLLEQWAAKVKLEFDFGADGQSFKRSQKAMALLDLAREYRSRQQPRSVHVVRGDVNY